jgi:succinate dehydrogenase / fumarate reductase iron-sulfur subunit
MAAKLAHLGFLPQGQAERHERVLDMVAAAESAGFGHCTNAGECEAVCPKGIKIEVIARMNRDFIAASLARRPDGGAGAD